MKSNRTAALTVQPQEQMQMMLSPTRGMEEEQSLEAEEEEEEDLLLSDDSEPKESGTVRPVENGAGKAMPCDPISGGTYPGTGQLRCGYELKEEGCCISNTMRARCSQHSTKQKKNTNTPSMGQTQQKKVASLMGQRKMK